MNKFLTLSFIFFLIFTQCQTKQALSEKKFHVWGNCEKCRNTIEKACVLDGVVYAKWDADSKLLNLKIDTSVVKFETVLKSVANSGYDNELYFGNNYTYSKLPECCQYERKDISSQ